MVAQSQIGRKKETQFYLLNMTIEERLQAIEGMISGGIIKLPCHNYPNRFLEIAFDGEKAVTQIVEYETNRRVLATGTTTSILQIQNP